MGLGLEIRGRLPLFGELGLTLGHHLQNGLVQKPAQQPQQNDKVEDLGKHRKPVN